MNFKQSFKYSLYVFLFMCLVLLATKIDSYYWAEPTTDADYRVRGIWLSLGWTMTLALTISTFAILTLLELFRLVIRRFGKH